MINSQSPRAWKVTFYQNEMVQAGSERALYEIARSLDRSTFYTRLLARSERPEDHYTRAMRAAGYETRALDLWPPQRGWEHSWWGRRVAPRIHRAYRQKRREEFRALMRDSDLLAVFLAENFRAVRDWLEPGDSVALFHMSHSAQFGRSSLETVEPVDGCTLVLMDEGQREEVERSAWSGQPVELLPLVADLEGLPDSFVSLAHHGRLGYSLGSPLTSRWPRSSSRFSASGSECRRLFMSTGTETRRSTNASCGNWTCRVSSPSKAIGAIWRRSLPMASQSGGCTPLVTS